MAEAFIGMTVSVKLKPGSIRPSVTGKVVNIHDQNLLLEQVYIAETGETAPSWTVPSYQIADLEVVNSSIYQPQFPSGASTLPIRVAPTYSDPAILSFARPMVEDELATPTLITPAKELPAEVVPISLVSPRKVTDDEPSPSKPPQPSRTTTKKGRGWRSTPLLEETAGATPETPPPQVVKPKKAGKNKRAEKRIRDEEKALQNGWATEDASDVQNMGDFDFEANLSKFDKQAVFDEIRIGDTTADEDRLVSHNRLARPGTYGGKNLHPTENVLSPPMKTADSELGTPSEAGTELEFTSGRASRQSLRSRRTKPTERTLSGTLEERSLSRALRNVPSHTRPLNASVISSNSLNRSTSSIRAQAHFSPSQHRLRIAETTHPCPLLSPERLRRVEEDYARRSGLSSATLLELTGRAIASSVCSSISKPSMTGPSRRNSKSSTTGNHTHEPKPVVVILAGNSAKGGKAIAAARHLYGRGLKILISCSDFSAPESWHPLYKSQISLLQSLGRKAFARLDSWPGISAQIKKLSSPPALILDALLDGIKYGSIEDVGLAFESREVVDWMNRSRARVVSVECPSGYDALTGETTVLEGEPLAVKPDVVLALGGVVSGVGEAIAEGESWRVTVLDVGLNIAMRGEETVRFDMAWEVDVERE
ncbi:YjeF-like protein [Elsinoe fawcettii]|nr:YjeF-like protein [Elsinoe fawcettii]